jgi:hypothetical protein
MRKLGFFKYAYLIFAILFFYEFIVNIEPYPTKAIVCLLMSFLAIFIFFFRKKFQDRFNSRNK